MTKILLTKDLYERGFDSNELNRMARHGELIRVRRGAYADGEGPPDTVEDRHRQLVLATTPQLEAGAVISHASAAVLHGLPVWPDAVAKVHVSRQGSGGGNRRSVVFVHGTPLEEHETVTADGIVVTSLARTVVDLGRSLPFEQAVAAGDRALALGLDREVLHRALDRARGWPGVRGARRAALFVDGRSESVGESVSRVRFSEALLPAPTPQFEVFDDNGMFVGRSDFAWEHLRTLGEFDGKAKYVRHLKPGQSIEEAVYLEKLREDALRDLGWQVVRWTWAELYQRGVIADRLRRAFARTTLSRAA